MAVLVWRQTAIVECSITECSTQEGYARSDKSVMQYLVRTQVAPPAPGTDPVELQQEPVPFYLTGFMKARRKKKPHPSA